jgi:putative ABC transport system permease protein
VTGWWQDVSYAARLLRRAPAFTLLASSLLALGIATNSAIFSLLDAALLRPLPFHSPGELVMMWEHSPRYAYNRVSPLNFLDWSNEQHAFASLAAVAGGSRTLTGTGTAERIPGQAVTFRFFDVLAIVPVAGRTFTAEDAASRARIVVISERLWRNRFGSDPALIGGTLTLDGEPFTVIGVVPTAFQILYPADLWTMFSPRRSPEQRRQHYLQVIARLKPGVDIAEARTDMDAVAEHIGDVAPDTNKGWGVTIEPLHDAIVGSDLRTTSLVLAAVVAFVLLMACANVANLLLARALGRSREIAVRAAIGGSRGRIVRQLLVESLMLSALGGAAGLAVASAIVRLAPALVPRGTLPQGIALMFDARVALAGTLLTVLTAVLCGLVPAWHAANTPLAAALVAGGRAATRRSGALRSSLAIAEVAAAVLVVAGAGLLLRTLVALDRIDPGFRADRVLTGSIGLPFNRYDSVERMLSFYRAAERELASIPGVTAAALGGSLPLDGFDIGQGFEVVGDPPVERANMLSAHYQIVSAGYFRALGIDVLRGRPFTGYDTVAATEVCIVNEEFVRRYLRGRDPLGVRVSVQSMALRGGPTPVVREIVGVIRQVAEQAGEKDRPVEIYVPILQNPWFSATTIVQTAGDPLTAVTEMKVAIARIDKDLAVTRIRTMQEVAAESTSQPRFRARIVAVFGGLALMLAAAGIFGVLAYSVSQRAREFGIRVALGAASRDILRLVLGGALKLTAAGIVLGLLAASALTRFLATLLFAVDPIDPVTFGGTAGMLVAAALAACAAPAWRATRVNPVEALRQD